MKDDKIKLFGGNELLQLNLTVKSIQVISYISNDTDINVTASGWMTIFNGSRTFNLMDFTGTSSAVIGEGSLPPGEYLQVRIYISSAVARIKSSYGGTLISFNYDTAMPSKALKIAERLEIESGKTLALTLDIDPSSSVTRPAGTWTFLPTIKEITSQTTDINALPQGYVRISDG